MHNKGRDAVVEIQMLDPKIPSALMALLTLRHLQFNFLVHLA